MTGGGTGEPGDQSLHEQIFMLKDMVLNRGELSVKSQADYPLSGIGNT